MQYAVYNTCILLQINRRNQPPSSPNSHPPNDINREHPRPPHMQVRCVLNILNSVGFLYIPETKHAEGASTILSVCYSVYIYL